MIGGTSNTSEKSKMLEEAKSNLQKVVDSNEESKKYQEYRRIRIYERC